MPPILLDAKSRFGRLVVLKRAKPDGKCTRYWCLCDCGKKKCIPARALRSGNTRSCGCLGRECRRTNRRTHGFAPRGGWHPLYRCWLMMKDRCINEQNKSYFSYGGRGIVVCEEWLHDFAAYLRDVEKLGPRPTPRHSIDRKDNDGPYAPWNIRWASPKEQSHNKQRPVTSLTFGGKTLTLKEWSDQTGLRYLTLYKRMKLGLSAEAILTTPLHRRAS
jgi:hypothetical protein